MTAHHVDWTIEKIKEEVYAKGVSLDALARKHNVSTSTVRAALRVRLPAGERIISEFLGVPAHQIWPSRYHPDGRSRARPKSAPNTTGSRGAAHRQNTGAA